MVVYEGQAPYRLGVWPAAPAAPAATRAWEQPSRLLRAREALVPFTGREEELAGLAAWRDGDAPVAVRLLHGPGGQGKSRLAGRLAESWLSRSWQVLAAYERGDPFAPVRFVSPDLDGARGLLVIVDYAERWTTAGLLALLSDLAGGGVKVRVLLLARPAGLWWHTLAASVSGLLGVPVDRCELGSLGAGPDDRAALFHAARDRFAGLLGVPDANAIVPPDLGGEAYRQVLTVHMAALAAVLAQGRDATRPEGSVEVSAFLLARERAHWQAVHDRADDPVATGPHAMGQAVYVATLTGGAPHRDALAALRRSDIESDRHPGQILADHAHCYPPAEGDGPALELQPLYPDRLGEDFVALTTPGHPHSYPADPWAEDAAARLLRPGEHGEHDGNGGRGEQGERPPWTRHTLTVLVETARRWPHIAAGHLFPLLDAEPRLALDLGGAALTTLASLPGLPVRLMWAIYAQRPTQRHVELDAGIAALGTRLVREAPPGDPVEQTRLRYDVGGRLDDAGRYPEAAAVLGEAVTGYQRLAANDPEAYAEDLAGALSSHGVVLSKQDRREEARAATEQAVEIYRRLAPADPDAIDPVLAGSLSNLGIILAALRRPQDALAVTEEAVRTYRRLAAANPQGYDLVLGRTLTNLGRRLAELDRPEEALTATEQAVEIGRRLAAANPAAFEPDLGRSLADLGRLLAALDRPDAAEAPAEEAVRIHRRLAAANPRVFEPDLMGALSVLGGTLGRLERWAEAAATAEEGARVGRRVATADPDRFAAGLGATLFNLGLWLSRCERWDEALTAAEEAVQVFRRLAGEDPARFEPSLVRALTMCGTALTALGRDGEAIARQVAAGDLAGARRSLDSLL